MYLRSNVCCDEVLFSSLGSHQLIYWWLVLSKVNTESTCNAFYAKEIVSGQGLVLGMRI